MRLHDIATGRARAVERRGAPVRTTDGARERWWHRVLGPPHVPGTTHLRFPFLAPRRRAAWLVAGTLGALATVATWRDAAASLAAAPWTGSPTGWLVLGTSMVLCARVLARALTTVSARLYGQSPPLGAHARHLTEEQMRRHADLPGAGAGVLAIALVDLAAAGLLAAAEWAFPAPGASGVAPVALLATLVSATRLFFEGGLADPARTLAPPAAAAPGAPAPTSRRPRP
jgi:hypothetical protein